MKRKRSGFPSTVRITVSTGPESKPVPNVVGQDEDEARQTLEDDGFKVKTKQQETDDPTLENTVLDQNPSGGVRAEPGSTVTIYVGKFVLPSP